MRLTPSVPQSLAPEPPHTKACLRRLSPRIDNEDKASRALLLLLLFLLLLLLCFEPCLDASL
ncbi:hypothetical protein E2C01_047103 [Portunus trituberculatus]|uniref:Uncharacterized protein n=1 Tax=Portunus trituberculatus TaxID=210409 RepID=A0A5B7G9J9_PORTR|nr:hypothetical protein [Portunus trituberculatus]